MKRKTLFSCLCIAISMWLGSGFVLAKEEPLSPTSTYIVNSTGDGNDYNWGDGICETAQDNGICTLRAAIQEANLHSGADIIEFNSSLGQIRPGSSYPPLSDTPPTTIRDTDGIPPWIYGADAGDGAICFELGTSGNKIQGLLITGFDGSAVVISGGDNNVIGVDGDGSDDTYERNWINSNDEYGIYIFSGANNRISGNIIGTSSGPNGTGIYVNSGDSNLIGTDGDGTSDDLEGNVITGNTNYGIEIKTNSNTVAGNFIGTNTEGDDDVGNGSDGIYLHDVAAFNFIGTNGDDSGDNAEKNVISGNGEAGIYIDGVGSDSNTVAGNYIGTSPDGLSAIPNVDWGINLSDGAYNTIGTNSDGIGDTAERNIISGNGREGIQIGQSTATHNTIAGNYIGTNLTGDAAIFNAFDGIIIGAGSSDNTIGTNSDGVRDTAERNVISGNLFNGIKVIGSTSVSNTIAGNYIGTDAAGSTALGNGMRGITIDGSASTTIGGTGRYSGNLISGNTQEGIVFQNGATHNVIMGNFIGTDQAGTSALGNTYDGIFISASDNMVGAASAAARNVISCNGKSGIRVDRLSGSLVDTVIQGNYIGVFSDGVSPCGNHEEGIKLDSPGPVNDSEIGGVDTGEGNTIAFNWNNGVYITGSSTGNRVRGNTIYSNGSEGIELTLTADDGPTPNDADDSDTGPNNLQNYPVLNSAVLSPVGLTIQGSLTSTADIKFQVDFFTNNTCDPSGFGEGRRYLGQLGMITDGSGVANFIKTVSGTIPSGAYITATATDVDGNTSEFCACIEVTYRIYFPLIFR